MIQPGSDIVRALGVTKWQGDLWLLAMIAAVILTSLVTYHWVEVPFRKRFRKLAAADGEPKQAASEPAPAAGGAR